MVLDLTRGWLVIGVMCGVVQNLDWHTDPEIMKAIINFYTKVSQQEATRHLLLPQLVHAACVSW